MIEEQYAEILGRKDLPEEITGQLALIDANDMSYGITAIVELVAMHDETELMLETLRSKKDLPQEFEEVIAFAEPIVSLRKRQEAVFAIIKDYEVYDYAKDSLKRITSIGNLPTEMETQALVAKAQKTVAGFMNEMKLLSDLRGMQIQFEEQLESIESRFSDSTPEIKARIELARSLGSLTQQEKLLSEIKAMIKGD